ncbi:MAG: sulfurtransferase-like selenium metabolism protein YedF [Spirochaetes bacterium]|nr:sulfurtransferase-like selenium metabolism protein YedF [Spirochaetota bacterium]
MSFIVDAKGLSCPQPVILTKKALEANHDVTVLVDSETSRENVKRLASSAGCSIQVTEKPGGIFSLHIMKGPGASMEKAIPVEELPCDISGKPASKGPNVFVIASDTMGKGDDELGTILMKAFIHTIQDLDDRPEVLIFYNTGVRLAVKGSPVLDDLKDLEGKGVKILVCGTCLNFFELTGEVAAGIVSNMYDIAGAMSGAGRIVQP